VRLGFGSWADGPGASYRSSSSCYLIHPEFALAVLILLVRVGSYAPMLPGFVEQMKVLLAFLMDQALARFDPDLHALLTDAVFWLPVLSSMGGPSFWPAAIVPVVHPWAT
jgi:hypothetical protein